MSRAWHDEARALRAQGYRQTDIARLLGRSGAAVFQVFNAPPKRGEVLNPESADRVEPHVSRQPRRILPAPPDIMALCRQFAEHEIDYSELSRRLRVSG